MAAIQGDRIKRLQATNPRINPVPISALTPVSGASPAGSTIGAISNTAQYAATRPVGDITSDVLANSGTSIISYSSTLLNFINGAFQLSIGAGGLVQSVSGVNKLTLSPTVSRFAGDIITDGQIIGSGTNSSFAGYHGAVIGLAGANSAGLIGYGGPGNGWAVQAIATGGNAIFAQGDVWVDGGSVSIDRSLSVGGGAIVSGTLNVSGSTTMYGGLNVSSLNGYSSPNNIMAFVGAAYPANTTTPAGFAQVRTLSGGVMNVAFYV